MRTKILILGLICIFIFAYCKSPADPEIEKALNPGNPGLPVIDHFTASCDGWTATLSWKVTNAFRVEIDNGIGEVFSEGIRIVAPSPGEPTIYTLTAANSDGQVQKSCTVTTYAQVEIGIDVTMGITLLDVTPFQDENGYMTFHTRVAGEKLPSLTIVHGNPSDSVDKTIELELSGKYNEWGVHADWELVVVSSSISSEFLANAQFQCWVQLIPITAGISIERLEEQTPITFTSWTVGESKCVYFSIVKES